MKNTHTLRRKKSAALLAALGILLSTGCSQAAAVTATEPVYPKMVQYPSDGETGWDKWHESLRKQRDSAPEGYSDTLWDFYGDSTRTFLSGAQENRAYSPLSLYMALSMLAECASGESRGQISNNKKNHSNCKEILSSSCICWCTVCICSYNKLCDQCRKRNK